MSSRPPQGLPVEAQTYNLLISSCIKLGETQIALDVYKRRGTSSSAACTDQYSTVRVRASLRRDACCSCVTCCEGRRGRKGG